MWNALALLVGLLAIAGAALYVGIGWLKLQRQDREPDPFGEIDMEDPADLIRRGPAAQAEAEQRAWRDEQRRIGKTDDEIDAELDDRPVVAWL